MTSRFCTMLSIIAFVALASATPIATESRPPHQNTQESLNSLPRRIATGTVNAAQRSVCQFGADGTTPHDCPHVNSVLRAGFALFCLFVFLVLLHVWQAAKYNKIQAVFGPYIADDADTGAKTPYILLDESDTP